MNVRERALSIWSKAHCALRQKETGRKAYCNMDCQQFVLWPDGKASCLGNHMLPIAEATKAPKKTKASEGKADKRRGIRKVSGFVRWTPEVLMAVRTGLQDENTEVTKVSEKCLMTHYPGALMLLEDREDPICPICEGAVQHQDYGRYVYLRTRGEKRTRTKFAHNDCVISTMRLPRDGSKQPAAAEV